MIVLERVGPGASVQDLGRPGHLYEGVPAGGALVPELLVASNRALGNPDHAAALELPLHAATLRTEAPLTLAIDGAPVDLGAGESLAIPSSGFSARYVALPGGIDVPQVLGGRGTLVVAGLGGLGGRYLRAGDRLPARGGAASARTASVGGLHRVIRLVAGPDTFPGDAIKTLISNHFRVATAFDRTGTRLVGPPLPWPGFDRARSTPMLRGAIQVTLDGTPIVLGPDHPTTGGYPVVATIVSGDLGAFSSFRPGAEVRFTLA